LRGGRIHEKLLKNHSLAPNYGTIDSFTLS